VNPHSATPKQLALEFQRRIEEGEPYAADLLRVLNKQPLINLAPLGEYFVGALKVAYERVG